MAWRMRDKSVRRNSASRSLAAAGSLVEFVGGAVVAIGLAVVVAGAHRALACDGVGCAALEIGQGAHDTGVAIGEGARTAGQALTRGAYSLAMTFEEGFDATGRALADAGRRKDRPPNERP